MYFTELVIIDQVPTPISSMGAVTATCLFHAQGGGSALDRMYTAHARITTVPPIRPLHTPSSQTVGHCCHESNHACRWPGAVQGGHVGGHRWH